MGDFFEAITSVTMVELDSLFETLRAPLCEKWPFLREWDIGVDSAKRRAGLCRAGDKMILVSRHHFELNDRETVIDTILHELAHAICFEQYGNHRHDNRWKQIARTIGAKDRASGRFNTATAPWQLVHFCPRSGRLKAVAERHRRNKSIAKYHLRNRSDTKGQLYFMRTNDYRQFERGEMGLEEIELFQ